MSKAREQLRELKLRDGPGRCLGATQLCERLLDAIEEAQAKMAEHGRDSTHYEGCEQTHWMCAVWRILQRAQDDHK